MMGQFAVEKGQFDANSAQKPQPEMAASFLWESSETRPPFQLATRIASIEHAVDHSIYASGVFKGFRHVNESLLD